ncbi:hypothetical protein D3C84_657280 [compost metagenome]
MDEFERHRQFAFGQFIATGIQTLAQGLGIQVEQSLGIQVQVTNNQRVLVARMPGQRQHHADITACRRKTPGNMHHRLQQPNLIHHLLFAAQLKQPVVELRLFFPDQPCQCDGRANVRQRFVSIAVIDAVGGGQAFEFERHPSFVVRRPNQAIRPQGIRRTHHIDQVPATVTALPLAGIGVEEISVQAVTSHLVVETQGVVTRATSARCRQLRVYPSHEIGFAQTVFGQLARRDASDRAGRWMRQDVFTGLAIKIDRLVYDIEIKVSAQPRHLQRTVATRVDAGGFVVVPEDGGHGLFLN